MTKEYPEDFNEDFNEEIKKMKPEEIRLLNEVYLMFSSKFIEYIREMDTELFKRATDYATTVKINKITKK
jgi:uncharacterized membrane protein